MKKVREESLRGWNYCIWSIYSVVQMYTNDIFYITKYHNIYTENVWFVTISRSLIKKRICDIGCGNGYGIEISWIMVTWSSGFAQTFAQSCWNSWHETEMGFSSLLWCVYICEWNGLWNERKCWPITNWLDFWIVWELLVAGGRNYCPALMPHASGEVYVLDERLWGHIN